MSSRLREPALFALIVAAIVVAYFPALHGGFLWDDNAHVTKPELRSAHGLWRIWFDLGATQQYYPLLHSAFWLEHRIWGDSPSGYHAFNIVLHAAASALVFLILKRLRIPGALLATAVFALHPVQVESVAWITEQKNTLSAVFFFASALVYLRFDETRRPGLYGAALALFILALLSKPVTAILPGALLVVFWWRRGRLSWRHDALPLIPWFGIGAASGMFAAWVEHSIIGAQGEPFALSPIERWLLAGRVVCFYLAKLFCPWPLIFVYPRWEVDARAVLQYVYPIAALALLLACSRIRRRWRGPLASLLVFVGTLFPVLGFFNVYLFTYTYVADHFQYLACLAVIALVCAALATRTATLWGPGLAFAAACSLVGVLMILTWRQCRMYRDTEVLYRTTIAQNPSCWMAYNNLGSLLSGEGRTGEAMELLSQALRLRPEYPEAHDNMGVALMKEGRTSGAVEHYEKALSLQPGLAEIHNNLGNALARQGRNSEAIREYARALEIRPAFAAAHNNLGNALTAEGRIGEAIEQFTQALQLVPDDPESHSNLAFALAAMHRIPEATAQYEEVLRIRPDDAQAHFDLGNVLAGAGRIDEAIAHYERSVGIEPKFAEAQNNLGFALYRRGRIDQAIDRYHEALRLQPSLAEAYFNLGVALAASGRTDEAIEQYRQALSARPEYPGARNKLGLALFGAGRIDEAIAQYTEALRLRPDFEEARNNLRQAERARRDVQR